MNLQDTADPKLSVRGATKVDPTASGDLVPSCYLGGAEMEISQRSFETPYVIGHIDHYHHHH